MQQEYLIAALFVWVCALTLYVQHLHIRITREHIHFTKELCDVYTRMSATLHLTSSHARADERIKALKRELEGE